MFIQPSPYPHISWRWDIFRSKVTLTWCSFGDIRRVGYDKHLDVREALVQKLRPLNWSCLWTSTRVERTAKGMAGWEVSMSKFLYDLNPILKAACRYLMAEYDRFRSIPAHLLNGVYPEVHRPDCSWHLYLDNSNSQCLQVSIVRLFSSCSDYPWSSSIQESPVGYGFGLWVIGYFHPPKISMLDMEAIENILSHRSIPNERYIDKRKCLLAIYRILMNWHTSLYRLPASSDNTVLVSPMRKARAARLTFDREFRFKWSGWSIRWNGPKVEMSRVTIGKVSWTWYVQYRRRD